MSYEGRKKFKFFSDKLWRLKNYQTGTMAETNSQNQSNYAVIEDTGKFKNRISIFLINVCFVENDGRAKKSNSNSMITRN